MDHKKAFVFLILGSIGAVEYQNFKDAPAGDAKSPFTGHESRIFPSTATTVSSVSTINFYSMPSTIIENVEYDTSPVAGTLFNQFPKKTS